MNIYLVPAVALVAAVGGWFAISGSTKESAARVAPAVGIDRALQAEMTTFANTMTKGLRALYGRIPSFRAGVSDPVIDYGNKTITLKVRARDMENSITGPTFFAALKGSYLKEACPAYMSSSLGKQGVTFVQLLHYKGGDVMGPIALDSQTCARVPKG